MMTKEEEFDKELLEISKPGDVEYITVSGTGSRLVTRFCPPLALDFASSGYEMALCRLETFYSFPNIDNTNNSIRISIDNGKNWMDLRIPTGCYDITGIDTALQILMEEKTQMFHSRNDVNVDKRPFIILTGNRNTFRCVLEILKDTTIVDFNVENSLSSVLGFEMKQYPGKRKRNEGENRVDILRVNSIRVHCDVINSSRINGVFAPVIYSFFPNVSPADKIICQPQHLMYVPLSLNTISLMTSWITDQEGELLDLRGERLTLTFHIRKRR